MYTYCLYCEAGKSPYVAGALMAQLHCQVIIPKQIQHTYSKGKVVNRARDLLPGYLFLYSGEPVESCVFQTLPGVLRCLRTDETQYALQGKDRDFALFLLENGGIIGKTQVIKKDGKLEISPISFRYADVKITRVDRRNKRMQIEIHFLRHNIRTWIEYEVVEVKEKEREGTEKENGNSDSGK